MRKKSDCTLCVFMPDVAPLARRNFLPIVAGQNGGGGTRECEIADKQNVWQKLMCKADKF